jgi:hypothetical protein
LVKLNIIYQDNTSTMKLERNGKESSGKRTRHFDIKYFYVTDLRRLVSTTLYMLNSVKLLPSEPVAEGYQHPATQVVTTCFVDMLGPGAQDCKCNPARFPYSWGLNTCRRGDHACLAKLFFENSLVFFANVYLHEVKVRFLDGDCIIGARAKTYTQSV